MTARRRPYWQSVTDEALREPALLARVLAGMGFVEHLGTITWGDVRFWPPDYVGGLGARLHGFASLNRSMRDSDVHVLMTDGAQFLVSAYAGVWRNHAGSQRGDDLPSLGALMWGIRYGQAAGRIARIIGLRRIPEVADA